MKKFYSALAGFLLLSLSSVANASLIGDTITIDWQHPQVGQFIATQNVVVGEGVEISCFNNISGICEGFLEAHDVRFDIGAESIAINFFNIDFLRFAETSYNGFIFNDLDWVGMIGSITGINLITNIDGLGLEDLGFGTDFVSVDFGTNSGATFSSGSFLNIELETAHQLLPAPATLILFGLGLAVLGWARRNKA